MDFTDEELRELAREICRVNLVERTRYQEYASRQQYQRA